MIQKLSQIPDCEKLRKTIDSIKSQLKDSLEYIDTIEADLESIDKINNQTEKTDYMDSIDEIKYLIQDYRLDSYSPLALDIAELRNFLTVLNCFESTDYLDI